HVRQDLELVPVGLEDWLTHPDVFVGADAVAAPVVPDAAAGGDEVDAAAVAVAAGASPEADAEVVVRRGHARRAGDAEVVVEILGDDQLAAVLGVAVDGAVLDRPDLRIAVPAVEGRAVEDGMQAGRSGDGAARRCR